MNQTTTDLIELRASLGRIRQRREYEEQHLARQKKTMSDLEEQKTELVQVVALIDKTISVVSANGIGSLETTVTKGLQLVFDDPTLSFHVRKREGQKGNTYYLEVQHDDHSGPILETFGGGIANVVSFLLRVLMIKRFKLGRLLVCDESFNNVAAASQPAVSDMLHSLVTDGGYTILAITHAPILASAADRVYRVHVPWGSKTPTLTELTTGQKVEISIEANKKLAVRATADEGAECLAS